MGNSKFEARNPKQAQRFKMPMFQIESLEFGYLNFGFVSNFDIRISDFIAK